MNHVLLRISIIGAVAGFTCLAPLCAQGAQYAGPGVARLSQVSGNVTVQRDGTQTMVAATPNAPVFAGDYLASGPSSRAEVQLDSRSVIRSAEDAQVRFVRLEPGQREVQLGQGTAELAMLRGAAGRPQIDTPSLAVRGNENGLYRVSVTPGGQTLVTVRSGSAAIVTQGGAVRTLRPGSTLVAQGPESNPSITYVSPVQYDQFDQYNQSRDNALLASLSGAYGYPAINGAAGLNSYGQWNNSPTYGNVWYPNQNQTPGWSPYQNGNWAWTNGYGWTWNGNEPWAWAPYHYGSWINQQPNGWGWVPPQTNSSSTVSWLPALVGFLTSGSSFGNQNGYNQYGYGNQPCGYGNPYGYGNQNGCGNQFGSPFSTISWVPLAPGEPYQPWSGGWNGNQYWNGQWLNGRPYYGNNGMTINRYVTNTYITKNVYITKIYRNARYPRAIIGVSVANFRAGHFAHPLVMNVRTFRNVRLVRGALPLVPTQANLRFNNRPVVTRVAVSTVFANRRFAGHPVPPAMSFAVQRMRVATTVRAVVSSYRAPTPADTRNARVGAQRSVVTRPGEKPMIGRQSVTKPEAAKPIAVKPTTPRRPQVVSAPRPAQVVRKPAPAPKKPVAARPRAHKPAPAKDPKGKPAP